MAENVLQGVIETVDEALLYRNQLQELQDSLTDAKKQVINTASQSRQKLIDHLNCLKSCVSEALDERFRLLDAQLNHIEKSSLEPLNACEVLLNERVDFAASVLKTGYVTDVLDDAKIYSQHANKKNIDADDIKLAVQCKLDHSFTNPPPRELLLDVARHKNTVPLPVIKPYSGPKLPPDRYCLNASNFKLRTTKKVQSRPMSSILTGGSRIIVAQPSSGMNTPTIRVRPGAATPLTRIVTAAPPSEGPPVKRQREDDEDYDI